MNVVLSFHLRHDASLSIALDNKIISYVEFEKVTKKRYFSFSEDAGIFLKQCQEFILPFIKDLKSINEVILSWATPSQENILRELFPDVKIWKEAHHHISHAWSSYVFTEPQENDLILSYDGGGDLNDYFKIFNYKSGDIIEIKNVPINLGRPYRLLGLLSPELYKPHNGEYSLEHALAGKIMALASLGSVIEEYKKPLYEFFVDFEKHTVEDNFSIFLTSIGFKGERFLTIETARNVLATSQKVFEEIVEENFFPYIERLKPKRIIICGGCALNVTMNSKISNKFNIPMFISPCPNDCGVSLGAIKMFNHNLIKLDSPVSNILPKNENSFFQTDKNFIYEKFEIKKLAGLLAEGKVIGTFRGYLEIGPRALGNRSYLANPFIPNMKDKVNTMKGREFWRPVAPIILEELLDTYFITKQSSPYMSFAPKVRPELSLTLKEILHVDDTARIQTVNKSDGWIYDLLCEFKNITGWGIIMNTSFNKKGDPLINDFNDAFDILKSSELDGIAMNNDIVLKKHS